MTPEARPGDIRGYLAQQSDSEAELRRIFRLDESLVIFDIGACEGEDSIRYARRYPRARIYTFEPLPENQRYIRDNFARYGVINAELLPLALSDQIGNADFHVSSGRPPEKFAGEDWNYGNKSSSLLAPASDQPMFGWIKFDQRISVPCTTLDQFCMSRGIAEIDFIHMDVQGAEHLVINGAKAMLNNCRCIWLEVSERQSYRGQKVRAELETLMLLNGFVLTREVSRGDEGDQFYVNRRFGRMRRYVIWLRLLQFGRSCRAALGRVKRRFVPARP